MGRDVPPCMELLRSPAATNEDGDYNLPAIQLMVSCDFNRVCGQCNLSLLFTGIQLLSTMLTPRYYLSRLTKLH